MAQYIDKSAVIAEIEKMLKEEYPCDNSEQTIGYHCALYELQDFLNTLEIKEDKLFISNIDDVLKEEGLDPCSKEAKNLKESYYMALEKLKVLKRK